MIDLSMITSIVSVVAAVYAVLKSRQEISKIKAEAAAIEGKIKHEIIDAAYTTIKQLRAENDKLRTQRDVARGDCIEQYDALEVKHDAEIRMLKSDIKKRDRALHRAKVELRKSGGNTGILYESDPDNKEK